MKNNPLQLLRASIKYCLLSYLTDINVNIKVNFNEDNFNIIVKCKQKDEYKIKDAFNNCWILNQLKTNKTLTIIF